MKNFRFAIMGAGNIANKFCDAVKRMGAVSYTHLDVYKRQVRGCWIFLLWGRVRQRGFPGRW